MAKIVKRLKGGATHYVAKAEARGNVSALTPDRAKAAELADDRAAAVLAWYASRPLAGTFTAEPAGQVKDDPAPPPPPAPAPAPVQAASKKEPPAPKG